MTRRIEIPFTANPREFVRGLKVMSDDVDQFQRGLQKVEREGDDMERGLGDNFSDLARKADRSFDKVERDGVDAMTEIKEEASDSARETFASFDGSLESVVEIAQETSAQVTGALGGIGATVVGLAGAAGIGLLLKAYESWQEAQERINERAGEIVGIYREAQGALSELVKQQVALTVLEDKSVDDQLKLQTLAAQRGQAVEDLIADLLYEEDLSATLAANEAERVRLTAEINGLVPGISAETDEQRRQLQLQLAALDDKIDAERDVLGVMGNEIKAAEKAEQVRQQQKRTLQEQQDEQRRLLSGAQDHNRELGRNVDKDVRVQWKGDSVPAHLTRTAYKNIYVEWQNVALPDHLTRSAGYDPDG